MSHATILIDLAEGVTTITLNRPEVRNAFNDAMAAEVQAALKNAERDEQVRCVVITGAGQGFCAGQDLAAVRDRGEVMLKGKAQPVAIHELLEGPAEGTT